MTGPPIPEPDPPLNSLRTLPKPETVFGRSGRLGINPVNHSYSQGFP